jgi:hypothetical protein
VNTSEPCGLILCGDSRHELSAFANRADLIVTSPPYADARHRHYDSVHPDHFADWFARFHDAFWQALKPDGSLVINIKDKVVDGVRHRFVWRTIDKLSALGWHCIEDYIWHKPNPMPGFWPTRLRDGWEYCFHLAKTVRPFMNQDAVRKPVGDWVKSRLAKLGVNDQSRQTRAVSVVIFPNGSARIPFSRLMSSPLRSWVKTKVTRPSFLLSYRLSLSNFSPAQAAWS